MEELYANPKYYEIAFSYRDIPQEVRIMQEAVNRYSLIPVSQILEFGCGNSPHMEELLGLGYEFAGLDLCPAMLEYSRAKARPLGDRAKLFQGDMVAFAMEEPVDMAYTMLGSLYVKTTKELISHFTSARRALRSGGLYILDWCIDFSYPGELEDSWTVEAGSIGMYVQYTSQPLNLLEQTLTETIELIVDDDGTAHRLKQVCIRRAIFPQEFLFITAGAGFEFIGWWNEWDLNAPLTGTEEQINRNLAILRAK